MQQCFAEKQHGWRCPWRIHRAAVPRSSRDRDILGTQEHHRQASGSRGQNSSQSWCCCHGVRGAMGIGHSLLLYRANITAGWGCPASGLGFKGFSLSPLSPVVPRSCCSSMPAKGNNPVPHSRAAGALGGLAPVPSFPLPLSQGQAEHKDCKQGAQGDMGTRDTLWGPGWPGLPPRAVEKQETKACGTELSPGSRGDLSRGDSGLGALSLAVPSCPRRRWAVG